MAAMLLHQGKGTQQFQIAGPARPPVQQLCCCRSKHSSTRHPLHACVKITIRSIYPAAKHTSVRRMYLKPEVTGAASCSRQQSPWRCNSALPAFGTMLATTLPREPMQQQPALSKCCGFEVHCIILPGSRPRPNEPGPLQYAELQQAWSTKMALGHQYMQQDSLV